MSSAGDHAPLSVNPPEAVPAHAFQAGGPARADAQLRMEEVLRRSEERLRLATEAAQMYSWEVDLASRTFESSENAERVVGYALPESVDEVWTCPHPDDAPSVKHAFERAVATGGEFQVEYRLARPVRGEVLWVFTAGRTVAGADGPPVRVVGITQNITGRKRAEERLRDSEECLRDALEASEMGRWRTEVSTGRNTRDANFNRLLGLVAVETTQSVHETFAFVHPEDQPATRAAWEKALATRDGYQAEFRVRRADGAIRWLRDQGRYVAGGNGEPDCITGLTIDITERRAAEQTLRENEERLRLAVEAGRIGTCDWNYQTGEVRGNDLRFLMFGLEPRDRPVSVEEFFKLVHPDDQERVRRQMRAGIEGPGEHVEEYRIRRPDGVVRWISEMGRVVERRAGRPWRVSSVLFDVTARHESEAAVRRSEQTLRLVLENAREYAIISTDLERRVATWNAGAERLLGFREQEILGQLADCVFTLEDQAADVPAREARLALTAGSAANERWHRRKDGSRFWGSGLATVMRDAQGEAFGFVNVFRDQTQVRATQQTLERSREELQAALAAAERAREEAEAAGRAKDHFLAVLSHELRTPLTPVLMMTRALARRTDLPAFVADALAMIERNVQTEAHFVDEMLDLTRITHGKLEIVRTPMDLHEAVRRAVEVTEPELHDKAQRLETALEAAACQVEGDFARLQQAFWNLLKNASKFTPARGVIRLASRQEEPGWIAVEVTDTGIGIAPDALVRIFGSFEQADASIARQFGGLGLGLAIAKATVEAHGGTLVAGSPGLDQGATFTVRLPLAP